jgi:hypothetical protein
VSTLFWLISCHCPRDDRTSRGDSAARRGSVHAQWCEVGQDRSFITCRRFAAMFALVKTAMVSAAVWDEASVSAQTWAWASVSALESL